MSNTVRVVSMTELELDALLERAAERAAARVLRLHAAEQRVQEDGLVTPAELARLRRVHRSTVARWVKQGCPCHQQPGGRRFDPRAVDRWLAEQGGSR